MVTYIFNSDYLLTEKILPFLNDRVLLPGLAGRVLVELTSFESVTKVFYYKVGNKTLVKTRDSRTKTG